MAALNDLTGASFPAEYRSPQRFRVIVKPEVIGPMRFGVRLNGPLNSDPRRRPVPVQKSA